MLFVSQRYFANPDFVRLSTELARRGHRISVATSLRSVDSKSNNNSVNILEITPLITIHSIPYSVSFPFLKMYRVVREQRVEIIHALMDYSTNTASAAAVSKMMNVPFVYTVQGIGTRTDHLFVNAVAEFYDWTIERLIARVASRAILLSKSLVSRTRKVGIEDSRSVVIPSGVDLDHFNPRRPEVKKRAAVLRNELGISSNNIVIGYVGRLVPAKGLSYLILALKHIEREHPDIVLLIIGDGPEKANLERMAKDLKIKTVFAGWQSDTAPYYAIMGIFVLPSLFEGLPLVILEAMAMGKPVVATNVGGTADLIANRKNGFLVPVRDHERIASALKELIEDSNMRIRIGDINRQKVKKNFSWDVIVPKVEKVYNTLQNPRR
ncbi:MAG: glycosyltransferase family 4 protein [Promethearchaeota archaeon]